MKILHAPSNVCNIGWAMAEGLRKLGHNVELWSLKRKPTDFPVDRAFQFDDGPRGYVQCLMEALDKEFDVFHFHGTRSLVARRGPLPNMWDLPILKSLGKKIVFTFHGSEIRLRSLDVEDKWSFHNFSAITCDETKIKTRLDIASAYADHLTVANILNQKYVPGAIYIPKAIDLPIYRNTGILDRKKPIVLHATRRRETKGTAFIIDAAEQLRSKGLDFEFQLLENVPHAHLLERISQADIVIEKVLSGDAGVLALESLAMGKVVMSRVRPEVYQEHPDMPVINVDPETVQEALGAIISDSARRHEVAQQGRPYVERNHSPEVIATKLEKLYETPSAKKARIYSGWREKSDKMAKSA